MGELAECAGGVREPAQRLQFDPVLDKGGGLAPEPVVDRPQPAVDPALFRHAQPAETRGEGQTGGDHREGRRSGEGGEDQCDQAGRRRTGQRQPDTQQRAFGEADIVEKHRETVAVGPGEAGTRPRSRFEQFPPQPGRDLQGRVVADELFAIAGRDPAHRRAAHRRAGIEMVEGQARTGRAGHRASGEEPARHAQQQGAHGATDRGEQDGEGDAARMGASEAGPQPDHASAPRSTTRSATARTSG